MELTARMASRGMTAALALALVAGCATKGALKRAVDEQRNALATERSERMGADSALGSDVASVRTEVAALKADLQALRTEYGAKITALESGMQFAMPVNFAFDDASVRQSDTPALTRFAQVAQKYYNGSVITVEGFADPAGTARYNLALSQRRAEAVKTYLIAQGLAAPQVKTVGYGAARQVVPGAERDQMGAESNRRVVFVVESRGQTPVALGPSPKR